MGIEFYCGLVGIFAIPFIAWLISSNRSKVMWKVIIGGLSIQIILGILVLLTQPGQAFFTAMNDVVLGLLNFSDKGAEFLFGNLIQADFAGAQFAFSVLPTIIFFSALMSILYYSGFMQKLVEFVAWIIMKILGTSGAETLSVSSNIFVGQTEAPLVVRPFIKDMTKSELNTVMTGGFATVAGGVMAAYVGMLHSHFPAIAGHLITASIMSAPAAIVMSKLTFPEEGKPKTGGEVQIDVEEKYENILDAAASGAAAGLKLALNVAAMLLAFIAIVHMANFGIGWLGNQLHTLVTDTTGMEAFMRGAIVGIVPMAFYMAHWKWGGRRTKYWITGLLLVLFLPVAAFYILPDLLSVRLGLPGFRVWGIVGALGGFILGAGATFKWFRKLKSLWIKSLAILIGVGAVTGFLFYMLGGSYSHWGAGAVLFGVFGLIAGTVVYWKNPCRETIIKGLIILGAVAGAGAILTVVADFKILNILQNLTLQRLFGFMFSGLAVLIGIPWTDLLSVGRLIGEKVAVNEFVAFLSFQNMATEGILQPRSLVIVSYALCGFANFSSIAIQIGGIGGIAPSRTDDLAKLGLRAMTAGVLASAQTAAVAGVMYGIAEQIGIQLVTLA
ncbi:MAG: NupC/NupG family nucleoside CNT transporter [Elusimicrobiota bacterium]